MDRPYRAASRNLGLWLVLVFAGVGGIIALASLLPLDSMGVGAVFALAAPLALAIGVAAVWDGRLQRRRLERIAEALFPRGYTVVLGPHEGQKAAFFAPISHLASVAGLLNGAAGIQWYATRTVMGGSMSLFEHSFTTGSGKSTQEHLHTFVAWSAGCHEVGLARWAATSALSLIRYRLGEGMALARAGQDLTTGDPAFDRDWVVWGDPALAAALLTPERKAMLEGSPRGERWFLGGGWAACAFTGTFDAENLEKFTERAKSLLGAP